MKLRRITSCGDCPFSVKVDPGDCLIWWALGRVPDGSCEDSETRDSIRRVVLAHQAGKESGK